MPKKLVIPFSELPAPSMASATYEVRYRITSEDRNRVSAWTPIFTVDPEVTYATDGDILLQFIQSGAVSVSWSGVSIMKNVNGVSTDIGNVDEFDVWIRWSGVGNINPGDWLYQGRIASQSITITVPALYSYGASTAAPKYFEIEVYRPSTEKVRSLTSGFRMYNGALDIQTATITGINSNITTINNNITTLYEQDEDNFAISLVL